MQFTPNQQGKRKNIIIGVSVTSLLIVGVMVALVISKGSLDVRQRAASVECTAENASIVCGSNVPCINQNEFGVGVCEGSVPEVTVGQTSERANRPLPIFVNFPQDYGPHPTFDAEWWYTSLSVTYKDSSTSASNKESAHLISFSRFKQGNSVNNTLLTSRYDQADRTFREYTIEKGSLNAELVKNQHLRLSYSGSRVVAGKTIQYLANLEELPTGNDRKHTYRLSGNTPEMGKFEFLLKERTAPPKGMTSPLLWGCTGKISVFAPDDTFYYSIPDLDVVSGSWTIPDGNSQKKRIVTGGKAWMDHQWFNTKDMSSDWKGHYWMNMSVSIPGDASLSKAQDSFGFVTQMYKTPQNTLVPKYSYWVKRNRDGSNDCGWQGAIKIQEYANASLYPTKWTLDLLKGKQNVLSVTGVTRSTNSIFHPPLGPQFYEPPMSISGRSEGVVVSGQGFFETHLDKQRAQ